MAGTKLAQERLRLTSRVPGADGEGFVVAMPIGRYFVYIGSLLLALLLLVDWYTPPPSTEQSSASVDRSTIRI
ncbi:hypothetical protein ABTK10_20295, partial [Acinetobacter baumannii]